MTQRTTANEPVDAIDPGGTRPAKGKAGGKTTAAAKGETQEPAQKVVSGDRNTVPGKHK